MSVWHEVRRTCRSATHLKWRSLLNKRPQMLFRMDFHLRSLREIALWQKESLLGHNTTQASTMKPRWACTFNARWYNPLLGRFAQADTIVPSPANPQAFNLYAYILNNPLRFIENTRTASVQDIWSAAQDILRRFPSAIGRSKTYIFRSIGEMHGDLS